MIVGGWTNYQHI